MIKEVLTQKEADAFLKTEKVRISHTAETFPEPGEKPITFDLKASQGSEKFLLDITRGRIKSCKCTYQNRVRKRIILARLDIEGRPHCNPDSELVNCPHIHLYREGHMDKWAWPAEDILGILPPKLIDIYNRFCEFCTIVKPPVILPERG